MTTRITAAQVRLKRAYAPASPDDGQRLLVDRLWPRGVSKVDAALDLWLKDLAPSTALRQWFGHEPSRWAEFCERYLAELRERPADMKLLRTLARQGRVTLIYGARDEQHNEAVALRNILLGRRAASNYSTAST